jgi:hypothetical protein
MNTAPTAPFPTVTFYAVFAYTEDGNRFRLSGWYQNQNTAVDRWYGFDDARFREHKVTLADGEAVRFFAVRASNDPDWVTSPVAAKVEVITREDFDARPVPEPEPAPTPKAKRKVTRTIDGIKWVSKGDKTWVTEDGVYTVEYVDDFETECDDEHPVKLTGWMRVSIARNPHHWPGDARWAVRDGKRGYKCPGGQIHHYGLWVGGATEGEPQVIVRSESFKDAAMCVATYTRTGKTFD